MRRFVMAGGLALALLVLAVSRAPAVIEVLMPLEDVIQKQSTFIFTAKVEKIDPDKPGVVMTIGDTLKGKVPLARLPINLTGDAYAKKRDHTAQLLKRLAPKQEVVVFVKVESKQYIALAYANGTWFQLIAPEEGDKPVWSFTHCEPYLRRTFKGTTAEMQQAVADSVAGKKTAPAPNPKEKPGLGPEVQEKDEGGRMKDEESPAASGSSFNLHPSSFQGGPLFAVIPTVAIGGVVSLLAMLFPAVFGGLTGQLKRWMAVISVASLDSTLLFAHDLLTSEFPGKWWGTKTALWLAMTLITVAGVLWAWRRQMRELALNRDTEGNASGTLPSGSRLNVPDRYEFLVLLILSGIGVVLFAVCLLLKYPLLVLPWSFVLALWVGIWIATLHVLVVRRRSGRAATQPALSSEGVILGAMVATCLALAPAAAATGGGGGGVQGGDAARGASFLKATAVFAPQGTGGAMVARPLIDGDRIYAAVAYAPSAFGTPGNLYCVDRTSREVLWDFNGTNSLRLKEVFSSPCLADGKLYVGEGFHSDAACKLYCVDAATGKKLWTYDTESHTESSPCVADGKVYCGAGSDGLLCLDAATGAKVWEYKVGHIDCPPVVMGGRVYCGSGVDRDVEGPQETAIFCLDAHTGREVWKEKTNLPVWGKPVVTAEQAFFPLGNGDAFNAVEAPARPAGAIVCVSPKDGTQLWRFDVPDGVIEGPAVDGGQVYFGCRDGHCYCVGRADGRFRWKHDLGSPVIATPATAACSYCGATNSVYAVARDGKVCCLDVTNGHVLWQYDVVPAAQLISPPVVLVQRTPQGDRRALYFGAGLNASTQLALYCIEDQWQGE